MSSFLRKQIALTKNIRYPNKYIKAVYDSYKKWAFDEEHALEYKGKWLSLFSEKTSLDLEIGSGTGKHFARLCLENPTKAFLAIEMKYKPLIQTIRRVRKNKSENARVIRYDARWIKDIFKEDELNSVYIHFPDPWLKKRRSRKHQLIQIDFCQQLYHIQKKNSFLEFKTDSLDYFNQTVKNFKKVSYKLQDYSENLYLKKKPVLKELSQFELIFVTQNIPIKYALFTKN
ncbi:MAG: hypothetical protein GDA46_04120 [Bdellovibrionales bacterium]|nr:hypothetical protein [Bdellovibrionales bacterium]